ALLARLEIADPQAGLRVVARAVHEPAPVRRQRGAEGAADALHALVRLAALAVVREDPVEGKLRVVVPVAPARALRVPDPAAVRAELRAERLAEPLGLEQLHARPAVDVPEAEVRIAPVPEGAGAEARHHVATVGRPVRRLRAVRVAAGDLRRVTPVERDRPDV